MTVETESPVSLATEVKEHSSASLVEYGDYYDSYDEAREAAESNIEEYEIPTDEYPSDWLFPIDAESVEIVEFDDEEA
jgi:hypothetical protein